MSGGRGNDPLPFAGEGGGWSRGSERQRMNLNHLRDWIGRSEERTDVITAAPVAALAATLDRDGVEVRPGVAIPPLWHWLYFTPLARQSDIGPDGHAKRGGFLPPVPLPRRMFAGGRFEFRAPLRIGDELKRVSRIKDVRSRTRRVSGFTKSTTSFIARIRARTHRYRSRNPHRPAQRSRVRSCPIRCCCSAIRR